MNSKRVMSVVAALGALVLTLLICSCGKFGTGWESVGQSFTLEGVKRISPEVTVGDDPQCYGQSKYTVVPTGRLLLRYENFEQHVSHVDVDPDPAKKKRVWVYVTAVDDVEQARARLKLCPLSSAWMMLATWRTAHPFGSAGLWKEAGGDYDPVACVTASPATERPSKAHPNRIGFDMTDWFIDSIRGRGVNHGWMLTASESVQVVGETSPGNSPRVEFDNFLSSYGSP